MENTDLIKTRSEINRQNGQLGGVKTDEGKKISRYNALKHGVLAQLISDYEKPMYGELLEELLEQYRPVGVIEQLLIERVAVWHLRLFRSARSEGEQMKSILSPSEAFKLMIRAYEPTVSNKDIEIIGRTFARYDAVFENRIIKLLRELERLQKIRKGYVVGKLL
jgi:hypothetical protein